MSTLEDLLAYLCSSLIITAFILRASLYVLRKARRNLNIDDKKTRKHGVWMPVDFRYPDVSPCPTLLEEVQPTPYRPFKWGKYHTTMGVRGMPWDEWIELDRDYLSYHRIRLDRVEKHGDNVVRVQGETSVVKSGLEAAHELVQELSSFLSSRYPETFAVTRTDNGGRIRTVRIVPTDEVYDIDVEEPMKVVALLIQDDVAIMIEGTDGHYYFQAGAICLAGSWRLVDKIGLPLEEIHTSGDVPHYQKKLHTSMERWFRRLPVDKPAARNNYFVSVVPSRTELEESEFDTHDLDPQEIAWSAKVLGPEESYPSNPLRTPEVTPSTICLRSERQTLRRLPISGAVVFTIRTYVTPLTKLGDEPGVPGRLASAVRSWDDDVAQYKGQQLYREVMLEYLDAKQAEKLIPSTTV